MIVSDSSQQFAIHHPLYFFARILLTIYPLTWSFTPHLIRSKKHLHCHSKQWLKIMYQINTNVQSSSLIFHNDKNISPNSTSKNKYIANNSIHQRKASLVSFDGKTGAKYCIKVQFFTQMCCSIQTTPWRCPWLVSRATNSAIWVHNGIWLRRISHFLLKWKKELISLWKTFHIHRVLYQITPNQNSHYIIWGSSKNNC